VKLRIKNKGLKYNQNNKYMNQIEIQTMTLHVTQYWSDTWHE